MILQGIKNKHLNLFQNEIQPATVIATQKWENILAMHDDENNLKREVVDTLKNSMNKPSKSSADIKQSNSVIESKPPLAQFKLISHNTVCETTKTTIAPNQQNKIYPTILSAMSNIEALIQVSASDGIRRSSGQPPENASTTKINLPFNFNRKQDGIAYIKQESYPKFPYVPSPPFDNNYNFTSETSSKSDLLKKSSFDDEFLEYKN